MSANSAQFVPFKKELFVDAMTVLDGWQNAFKGQDSDYLACKDGLDLAEELGLIGYMIYVEKSPAAFILGERTSPALFTIHFAKGLTEYKGIYPYLFQELAEGLSSDEICCLNWEQDLGQEGLRKSKLSYQPDKLAHKYRVQLGF